MPLAPSNQRVKDLVKLKMKKYRDQSDTFLVEGEHLVDSALEAGAVEAIFVLEGVDKYPGATDLSLAAMQKITDAKNPPNAVATCKHIPPKTVGDKVLILEHVQDPGNVGTLLRSARAFGFTTVVFDAACDPFSPKVLRATQGAIFDLAILKTSVEDFRIHHPNHKLIVTAATASVTPLMPTPPYALVLGNEGAGVTDATLHAADLVVSIPTEGVESLNVAMAGSVLMQLLSERPVFTTK